jgi:hypothetical protein
VTGRAVSVAVGGLPGQLLLDLPGLPEPIPARTRPPRAPRVAASRPAGQVAPAGQVVPVQVWAVWDGEDLVGVYAEERVARADVAVLRRDAVGAGVRASTVDCLPLPVYREGQHGGRRG